MLWNYIAVSQFAKKTVYRLQEGSVYSAKIVRFSCFDNQMWWLADHESNVLVAFFHMWYYTTSYSVKRNKRTLLVFFQF